MRVSVRVALAVAFMAFVAAPAAQAGNPQQYAALIASHARSNGIPIDLAMAVVRHESNFNPRVTGRAGEIGLMQIKLSTARGIGYRGSRKALYDPGTNLAWGMKYLGQARKLAGGSQCGTLSRYNGGLANNRTIRGYCNGVSKRMAELKRGPKVKVANLKSSKKDQVRVASSVSKSKKTAKGATQPTKSIFDALFASN